MGVSKICILGDLWVKESEALCGDSWSCPRSFGSVRLLTTWAANLATPA